MGVNHPYYLGSNSGNSNGTRCMSEVKRLARVSLLSVLSCLGLAASAWAGDEAVDPRADIAKKMPGVTVDQLKATPIPGIYEFSKGADVGYVTSDGRYFLGGDLYDIKEGVNLTDKRRSDVRRKMLSSLSDSEMIVFSPKDPKYTITVFTDVDCGYCRKLHSEITDLNRLGVRVRYAFYPREGPGSEAWKTAEAVWCSDNRHGCADACQARRGDQGQGLWSDAGRARIPDGARSECPWHAWNLYARRRLHLRLPAGARAGRTPQVTRKRKEVKPA